MNIDNFSSHFESDLLLYSYKLENKNIKEGITSNNLKGILWKCFDCYMRILTYFTTYLKASKIHLCKNESII